MDEDGEKFEVDWISNLPDSLKFEILLNLPTKDVVKTSVLSGGWKNLWRYVPGLDLKHLDFSNHDSFVSFVDSFLGFNNESRLQNFKLLLYELNKYEDAHLTKWFNTVVERKVELLYLEQSSWLRNRNEVELPQTLYTCESLVSLRLTVLYLSGPKFVFLPSLKAMDLVLVTFMSDLALETLISGCPALERLYLSRSLHDKLQVLRVRSQSLLSFTYSAHYFGRLAKDPVLVLDAPRLEYLRLTSYGTASFELNNLASLVKADINIVFNWCLWKKFDPIAFSKKNKFDPNDTPYRNVIQNFLRGISSVKDMIITSSTLKVIHNYLRCETLPLFCNLSSLRLEFVDYRWELLPIFLKSCPNLKSLVVGSTRCKKKDGLRIESGPRCLLKSLEYVEIERPLKGEAREMELVGYLLEHSPILKKLTVFLDDSVKKDESVFLKELLTIPRISTCQVVVV